MPEISTDCQRPRRRTEYETVLFLRRIEREHAAAMYGWSHPENVEWAAQRAAERAAERAAQREAERAAQRAAERAARRGTAYAAAQGFTMEVRR